MADENACKKKKWDWDNSDLGMICLTLIAFGYLGLAGYLQQDPSDLLGVIVGAIGGAMYTAVKSLKKGTDKPEE